MKSLQDTFSVTCSVLLLLVFEACFLSVGCKDVTTTWSAEVKSPALAPIAGTVLTELIERAEAIRKQWIDYFSITTGHRASMTANPH